MCHRLYIPYCRSQWVVSVESFQVEVSVRADHSAKRVLPTGWSRNFKNEAAVVHVGPHGHRKRYLIQYYARDNALYIAWRQVGWSYAIRKACAGAVCLVRPCAMWQLVGWFGAMRMTSTGAVYLVEKYLWGRIILRPVNKAKICCGEISVGSNVFWPVNKHKIFLWKNICGV